MGHNIVFTLQKNETIYLDKMSEIYRRKNYLKSNSGIPRSEIKLLEVTEDARGLFQLLYFELERAGIVAGLDDNILYAFDVSPNLVNRVMKSFFAKVRQSKRNVASGRKKEKLLQAIHAA